MWYNLRIFSREAHAGRGCGIDGRYLVHKICQPHEFVIVAEVETEHGIVDGFVADVDFLCEGFFGEMQQCGTEVQLLVELVLKVKSEQSLTLGGEHGLVLKSYAYALAGVDYALVGYGYYAHGIVDGVVGIFCKGHTSGSDNHRTSGHIHGIQPDLRAGRCLIFACEHKFVFVGKLSCHYERGVVKFLVDILFG